MPKIKTNKTASKKFRANAKGKFRAGRSNTSHNTSKRGPKRRRHLRHSKVVTDLIQPTLQRMMPYA
jgi:large subunit ribosomal protein L35